MPAPIPRVPTKDWNSWATGCWRWWCRKPFTALSAEDEGALTGAVHALVRWEALRKDRRGDRVVGSSGFDPRGSGRRAVARPDRGQRLGSGDRGDLSGWRHGRGARLYRAVVGVDVLRFQRRHPRCQDQIAGMGAKPGQGFDAPVYALKAQDGPTMRLPCGHVKVQGL
jgi:hypothetical protein